MPKSQVSSIGTLPETDVLVCGGGVSGCLAAIAAARSGVKTVLIERAGMLGGIAMTSMMNSMGNLFFTDEDFQVIRGIPAELMDEAVERGHITAYWKTNEYRQVWFDLEGFHQILLDNLWNAGVRIYTHSWATKAILDNNVVTGVEVQTRAGKKKINAKVVVDATGDLDVATSCGSNITINDAPGTSTLLFEVYGVDMQKAFEFFANNPENYAERVAEGVSFEAFKRNFLKRGLFQIQHHGGRYVKPLQDAIARGEFKRDDGLAKDCDALALFGTRKSGKVLVNSNFFYFDELNNLEDFSIAELSVRKICMNLYKTLKNVLPGFENAVLTHIGTELGCRKTRYLNGRTVVETLLNPRTSEEVVGIVPTIDKTADNGFFGRGTVDLPYGMLCPKEIDNLLVGSGKCVSANWKARTFLRYQPACMLIGQSVGTAAALAAKTGQSTQALDIHMLQKELLRGEVWLGGRDRLAELKLL